MPLILMLATAGLLLLYPQTSAAELAFESCWLNGSGGNGNLNAECATWQRPLDPDKPEGKQIELFVTRLASTALQPAEDALTIVNGGPGGSSVDLLVDLASIISVLTRNRDVIVIDQRGTGRSSPLHCEALSDAVEVLEEDQIRSLTQQCLRNLPHDPRFFSTTVAVDDLEALRQTLGYRQLSLYGVSYGTRVVQQYMRAYPEQTRAAVIDGVVPPQRVLGGSVAIHSENSLQAVFARCAATAPCAARFPQLKEDFSTLSARLRAAPIPLQLQHPVTGLPTEVDLDYAHLAMWIRFALYAPETTALIPLIIHQATHSQNYLPIAANALRFLHDITAALNYGMHNAVVCTEDAPFFAQQQVDYAALDNTYLGRDMYDTLAAMCSVWPAGVRDQNMHTPLQSNIPTLLLSGEFDPITPPAWAQQAANSLSNAIHIVAPGQGHGVIARGCLPRLIMDFIDAADPAAVDESCTAHMGPYPFFVDLMGPPP